jgi:peptidoglycan hydrolase-like protein with peptidoglycan-binding domain
MSQSLKVPRAKYQPRHREDGPDSGSAFGLGARAFTAGSVALTLPAVVVGLSPAASALAASTSSKTTTSATAKTAAAKTVTYPKLVSAKTLPKAVDMISPYIAQDSCDPVAKPGVTAFMKLILATYKTGFSDGIVRACNIGATSEHKEGRAWDWAIPDNKTDHATAQHVVNLLVKDKGALARRFGIEYIIWNRHIWGVYRMSDGWRPYSGESAHTDHVHFSFSWDGAEKRTSWWTGTDVTVADQGPCRPYAGQPAPLYTTRHTSYCATPPKAPSSKYAIVWPGQKTSSVKVAQKALKIKADGSFGAATRSALVTWQKANKVPVTGVLDKATWHKLVPAKPTTPTPPVDPPPPPTTPPGGGGTVASPIPTVDQLARTTSVSPYLKTVLKQGTKGKAVRALQEALAIKPFDGEFGPVTAKTVKAFQTKRHLPATGIVDHATWLQVQAVAYPFLKYRTTVLKEGSQGATVKILQKALKITADGDFGPHTKAAVKAMQKKAHLASTGTVAVKTWIALEAEVYPLGVKHW